MKNFCIPCSICTQITGWSTLNLLKSVKRHFINKSGDGAVLNKLSNSYERFRGLIDEPCDDGNFCQPLCQLVSVLSAFTYMKKISSKVIISQFIRIHKHNMIMFSFQKDNITIRFMPLQQIKMQFLKFSLIQQNTFSI